jgi:hypothetical protein
VAFGLLPATGGGVALATELPLYRWLRGAAGVLYLPEQPALGGSFRFGMTAAWLGACARPLDASGLSLSLCAEGMAGGIHSVVLTDQPVEAGEQAWVGASLDAVLRLRLIGPLEGEVGADLVVPMTRSLFCLAGPGKCSQGQGNQVFQQGAGTAAAFAGLGMSFP